MLNLLPRLSPMRFLTTLFLVLLNFSLYAQHFLLTPNLIEAWQEISRLRLAKAEQLLANERKLRPENQLTDIFQFQLQFQKALASGSSGDEEQFQLAKTKLQQQLTSLRTSDPWQEWALGYSGMTSLMLRMRAGDQWQTALEMRRTYSRIVSAYEKYPGFVPNLLTYGLVKVALGSVPDQFTWMLKLASLSGDSQEGVAMLIRVLNLPDNHPFSFMRPDAAILLGMATRAMQTDAATKEVVIRRIRTLDESNLMLTYTSAYLLMRDGKNEEALKVLHSRPVSPDYLMFPMVDYLMAEALLRKGSKLAEQNYVRFLRQTRGTMYLSDVQRKLGWIALLNGDTSAYISRMRQCREAPASGSERDAEAKREAASVQIPHPALLLARLRFDGGYFSEANEILERSAYLFEGKNKAHYLEYLYRSARIADGMGQTDKALLLYDKTYHQGLASPEYYAANSALRLGEIFEKKGQKVEAELWFNRCLNLKPQAYRTSIHAAARAGLRRIAN